MVTLRVYARAGCWTVLLGAIALWLWGCAVRDSATPAAVPPPIPRINAPPEWRPGDRWVYDWKLGAQTGTKTVEVLEIREVNEVPYYAVRIGDIVHYYTLDLQWAGLVRDSRVEARMDPPQPWFVWPLEVGDRWLHRGVYEEQDEKKEQNDSFAVVTAGAVEVPAGRFSALKVVREATGSRDSDQYWYAPEVRWYVRWIGRRGDVQFEERLRGYHPAPRLIPESA
ncbi:MAG: hypothetical protein ACE5MG_14175, partial [Candidatus Methylomirabilales bacterium]